ncbi:MAG: RND transporter [Betaproteobacteria bacterium HGW-Betaproteobacteria-20]|jgi:multidrug efflux system outer membrane protein|nr:MAG: RND transporter [Betaproteobacteria bacterium HGW-Betaproteobacteria-20]
MKKLTLILMLFLVACKAVGPDYKRSETNLPTKFSEADAAKTAENDVMKQWWQHYQDEQLNALIALSLKNNTNIQLSLARIEEADAVMREVGASLLPEVNFSTRAERRQVTQLGVIPVFTGVIRNNFTFGLSTSYEVDFWGKLKRAKESARATSLASRYAKETVELSLVGLVASNYLLLRSLDAQIAVTSETLQGNTESLNLTQRRLAGGVASILEVSQAEVAVSNLDAQLIELSRLRALSLHQLAILTGELDLKLDVNTENNSAQADIRALPMPPTPPAGLPSSLLENRPDVREAEQALIAENANIGIVKAALYPSISLTGTLGGESLLLKNLLKSGARVWSMGIGLDLPIFDFGKRQSRVEQATAKQKQALAQYQISIQNAFKEVNDALVSRRLNVEREQRLAQSQASAKRALTVAETRYKSGYSSFLEVLDAQRVHNEASLSAVQAKQASLLATVELFKALGGDWQATITEQAP